MLSSQEEKNVNGNVRDFYHVISCNASIFGEPFLENDYLYYFDGEVATLVSPRIKGDIDKASLNSTIQKIITKHSPVNLIFWGETPTIEIKNQEGYKLKKKITDPYGMEFIFRTTDFIPTSKYRSYLRKAEADGLKLKPVTDPYYKSEHTKLLAETHEKRLGTRSLLYYAIYPLLKDVKFFEVVRDKDVLSINIIIEALPNYVCIGEIGYSKTSKNISGISTAMLIDYYLDKTRYISWGGSANEGIFNFKQELVGKIPLGFYDNRIWFEFYKNQEAKWWISRMKS